MGILSQDQLLLVDYFKSVGMSMARGLSIIIMLWEPEATMEMIEYIVQEKEINPSKLYSVACEIAQEYKYEEEWLINDEDDLE